MESEKIVGIYDEWNAKFLTNDRVTKSHVFTHSFHHHSKVMELGEFRVTIYECRRSQLLPLSILATSNEKEEDIERPVSVSQDTNFTRRRQSLKKDGFITLTDCITPSTEFFNLLIREHRKNVSMGVYALLQKGKKIQEIDIHRAVRSCIEVTSSVDMTLLFWLVKALSLLKGSTAITPGFMPGFHTSFSLLIKRSFTQIDGSEYYFFNGLRKDSDSDGDDDEKRKHAASEQTSDSALSPFFLRLLLTHKNIPSQFSEDSSQKPKSSSSVPDVSVGPYGEGILGLMVHGEKTVNIDFSAIGEHTNVSMDNLQPVLESISLNAFSGSHLRVLLKICPTFIPQRSCSSVVKESHLPNMPALHASVVAALRKDLKVFVSSEILLALLAAECRVTIPIKAIIVRQFRDLPKQFLSTFKVPFLFIHDVNVNSLLACFSGEKKKLEQQTLVCSPLFVGLFRQEFCFNPYCAFTECDGCFFSAERRSIWVYIEIEEETCFANVYVFHPPHMVSNSARRQILAAVRLSIMWTCHRVNQLVLLSDLHETRCCSIYLIPLTATTSPRRLSNDHETQTHSMCWPGRYECPMKYNVNIKLHERLAPNLALNMLSTSALQQFQVHDRRHYFVYRDKQGCVFYFRLFLVEEKPRSSASIQLQVFGVADPTNETTIDVRTFLEKKLNETTHMVISKLLARNPKFQLVTSDYAFLQSYGASPDKQINCRLPETITDIELFYETLVCMLRRLSYIFLRPMEKPIHDKQEESKACTIHPAWRRTPHPTIVPSDPSIISPIFFIQKYEEGQLSISFIININTELRLPSELLSFFGKGIIYVRATYRQEDTSAAVSPSPSVLEILDMVHEKNNLEGTTCISFEIWKHGSTDLTGTVQFLTELMDQSIVEYLLKTSLNKPTLRSNELAMVLKKASEICVSVNCFEMDVRQYGELPECLAAVLVDYFGRPPFCILTQLIEEESASQTPSCFSSKVYTIMPTLHCAIGDSPSVFLSRAPKTEKWGISNLDESHTFYGKSKCAYFLFRISAFRMEGYFYNVSSSFLRETSYFICRYVSWMFAQTALTMSIVLEKCGVHGYTSTSLLQPESFFLQTQHKKRIQTMFCITFFLEKLPQRLVLDSVNNAIRVLSIERPLQSKGEALRRIMPPIDSQRLQRTFSTSSAHSPLLGASQDGDMVLHRFVSSRTKHLFSENKHSYAKSVASYTGSDTISPFCDESSLRGSSNMSMELMPHQDTASAEARVRSWLLRETKYTSGPSLNHQASSGSNTRQSFVEEPVATSWNLSAFLEDFYGESFERVADDMLVKPKHPWSQLRSSGCLLHRRLYKQTCSETSNVLLSHGTPYVTVLNKALSTNPIASVIRVCDEHQRLEDVCSARSIKECSKLIYHREFQIGVKKQKITWDGSKTMKDERMYRSDYALLSCILWQDVLSLLAKSENQPMENLFYANFHSILQDIPLGATHYARLSEQIPCFYKRSSPSTSSPPKATGSILSLPFPTSDIDIPFLQWITNSLRTRGYHEAPLASREQCTYLIKPLSKQTMLLVEVCMKDETKASFSVYFGGTPGSSTRAIDLSLYASCVYEYLLKICHRNLWMIMYEERFLMQQQSTCVDIAALFSLPHNLEFSEMKIGLEYISSSLEELMCGISLDILLKYIRSYANNYWVTNLDKYGATEKIARFSWDGTFQDKLPSASKPFPYSLIIGEETCSVVSIWLVYDLQLDERQANDTNSNTVLSWKKEMRKKALEFVTSLVMEASNDLKRDELWAKCFSYNCIQRYRLFYDSLSRCVPLIEENKRVTENELRVCLSLCARIPLKTLDPSIEMLLELDICWKDVLLRMGDIYGDNSYEYKFTSNHLFICYSSDFLFHLCLAGNNFSIEICKRERSLKISKEEEGYINTFMHGLNHWIWRSVAYDI